ncbi:MAG TPA: putative Ig domain-containing protein [Terriglobia bacterium]|nr:putative Ig domain-containing protein [Terriglobia bacterium]
MQFYIDGLLTQTDSSSPYVFNGATTGLLDTTTLPNGPHVLGARALFTDNRTYDFFGETVTVANPPQNTALPTISGTLVPGQTISTSNGSWAANAPPTGFSYQWEHCDSNGLNCAFISGAASSSYPLTGADTNFTMRSAVTASNFGGSTAAVSAQTGVVPPPPLVITTSSLPGGIQNSSYSTTVAATGGVPPYTWSITAGSLPAGLTLTPGSGVISGTPTSTGTSNFTVQVADTRSVTTTQALSLTVALPVTVTTGSLPAGTQLSSYSANLAASGGTPPYTWSISSGTLPSGLSLASGSGVISGTSTTAGTSNFTVQAKDANSLTATKPLSIVMNGVISGGSGIGLVQANSVQGSGVGSVSANFPVSNTAGNLILVFVRMSSATQTVSLADTAGNTYIQAATQVQSSDNHQTFLFYAKNISSAAGNTVTATFSSTNNHPWMAIYEFQGLSTTNPLDQTASAQGAGSTPSSGATSTTTATNELVFGGTGLASNYSGSLAAGSGYTMLENDPANSPAATEIALASSTGSYTATFGLNSGPNWTTLIATFAAGGPVAPVVSTASLPNATQNAAYSTTLTASGGTTPYSWSVSSGTLPAGLSLASGTGVISGTPTGTGTSNFTVQVTDANSLTGTKPLSLTVIAPPTVTTTSLPNATQNAAYSTTLTASGGTTPYSWSISSGTLPAGLSLASGTGVISGTPSATGTSNFTVTVTDANSITAAQPLSLVVNVAPLTVTTTSPLPSGTINAAYSTTLTATGGTTPYAWSISSGTLPSGLSLASATGVISGTPTAGGTSNFTVKVTDANSLTATQPLSLTVAATPPSVTTTSLPNGTQNTAYNTTLTASGGTTPYSWSVSSGTLPAGLTLASSTGVISGTPTGTGTSNFTVQVTDANSLTGTKALSLTINAASGGGIGLAQENAVQGSGVASVSVAFPTTNTAGNLILAYVRMSSSSQTVTLQDSAGNAYVEAVGQVQNADGSQVHLFYAKNILSAAGNTVTATFSTFNNHPWLAIYEYKGLNTANPLDQTANAQGTSAAPNSGATATTTSANELVFAAMGLPASYSGTQTLGSGYTLLQNDTSTSPASNESMLVTSTGSYAAAFSLTSSVSWSAIVATFKP